MSEESGIILLIQCQFSNLMLYIFWKIVPFWGLQINASPTNDNSIEIYIQPLSMIGTNLFFD